MEKDFIIVENVSEKQIETILMDLSNLYSETGFTDGIQLYENKYRIESFMVLFTNEPDFERFCYFVNYIRYPAGLKNIHINVRGYYKVRYTDNYPVFQPGERIIIYVDDMDCNYDNVNLVCKSGGNIYMILAEVLKCF